MPFPLIPVLVTAGIGTLGFVLFKPDAAAPSNQKGNAGTLGENTGPAAKPAPLPPAKRPADLPRPAPTPVVNNLPIPIPQPVPQPQPAPLPNILPNVIPNNLPNILPIPTPIEPNAQTGTIIAPSGANLRSGPSTSAGILYGMVRGTRVKILRYDSAPSAGAPLGWYYVTAPNGMTGYTSAEFTLKDGGAPAPPPPSPLPNVLPIPLPPSPVPAPPMPSPGVLTGTVLGNPGANLRGSPSTSGAIIVGLFNGNKVTILNPVPTPPNTGAPLGWLNVRSPAGQTGWMSAEFIRVDSPFGYDFGTAAFGDEYGDDDRVVNNLRKRTMIKG